MNTSTNIAALVGAQRTLFLTHQTLSIRFRKTMLQQLKKNILKHEKALAEALWLDLHKSYEEAFLTEFSIVLSEINLHIKQLKKWSKPKKVASSKSVFPSKSRIVYEPFGVALIIAPWNYPFQLLFNPLIGAISSGCCAILKPSPYTPQTAKVMETIISETFDPKYITLIQGDRSVNEALLQQKFDFIFFTGSPELGKVVMQAAAENLTPVILELGGKSPCVVDQGANLEIAAKRIAWGKTLNAGQTCVAPDYLLVHQSLKEELLQKIQSYFEQFYGTDPKQSPFFGRIVNKKAFDRLVGLLSKGRVLCGGTYDASERYIAPTIIDEVTPEDTIMQQEIFGPLLPVLTFENIQEVVEFINNRPKPLAFYYFGTNKKAKEIVATTTSGGACINDTIMHLANENLPFGGVGNSGIGKYHGKYSFEAFSNQRAILIAPQNSDFPVRYMPYKYFTFVKKLLKK